MFTGDRSGDWLYRALHRAGFASQPGSRNRDDGLELGDAYVTATVRCAPPKNRPTAGERDACRPWLEAEMDLLTGIRVVVALGGFAFDQMLRVLGSPGCSIPSPRPRFGHGMVVSAAGPTVIGSYHPSQQNTFTGRLTEEMLDQVFATAAALLYGSERPFGYRTRGE